ncbi:glycosyltransferase family 8 protein [Pleurocapsa sp. FMAR1]|uniref:glycosyltransferase family 8 protein n=1 Tax=Pleurocapsa sp. FMAR1 TaxID=3040204 RepID=UPI0029C7D6E6|nr:glycosyltransferase family 8 protein [Pleurocapsa sp. FMAR1]
MHIRNLSSGKKLEPFIKSENDPIIVVCAADNNYAMPLAVTMRSATENLKGNFKISFFVIDGGITNPNKQKLLKSLNLEKCEVEFVSISNSLLRDIEEAHKSTQLDEKKIKASYVSIASFYRLIIPELLSSKFEKAIYLDCDLVVKGNLGELWQTNIGNNYLLAAQDTWIPYVSSSTGKLNYQELGIESNAKYFNAGVLVINLKKWREDRLSDKAIKYFAQNIKHLGWYDQDVLNALFIGKWQELDPRWNMSPISVYGYLSWQESPFSEEIYNSLIRDPYIIHYVSAAKPWTSRHTLLKQYFFEYVDMTAWSGWRFTFRRRFWFWLIAKL